MVKEMAFFDTVASLLTEVLMLLTLFQLLIAVDVRQGLLNKSSVHICAGLPILRTHPAIRRTGRTQSPLSLFRRAERAAPLGAHLRTCPARKHSAIDCDNVRNSRPTSNSSSPAFVSIHNESRPFEAWAPFFSSHVPPDDDHVVETATELISSANCEQLLNGQSKEIAEKGAP